MSAIGLCRCVMDQTLARMCGTIKRAGETQIHRLTAAGGGVVGWRG